MTPSKIMSPGELAIGQYITVLKWKPREVPKIDLFGLGNDFGSGTSVQIIQDRSYCGDVLRIEAVDLPYLICARPNETYFKENLKLDTREVDLMELSPEYVKAAARKG